MSYDVSLNGPDGPLRSTERFQEGGTQPAGGTYLCELNITYNYAHVFGSLVSDLEGKTAAETLPLLVKFVERYPDAEPYERDYWAPTPGNVVAAIKRLISFAKAHPEGVWSVR